MIGGRRTCARAFVLGAVLVGAVSLLGGSVLLVTAAASAQDQGATRREFTVTARKYAFTPPRFEVSQNDVVKITFSSDDIAHSFTIDAYRIAKRVGPGQPVTFEFRADQPGRFPVYCSLAADDGCRQMKAELVVRPRP